MFPYMAVENVGREVLLIKNDVVVGEGYSQTSSNYTVSIEMRDDRAKELVKDSVQVKMWGESFPDKKFRYSMFHFSTLSGIYLDSEEMWCDALEDIRVVDKFNLRYGMVPDDFKNTEGYGAVHKEIRAEIEAEEAAAAKPQ